jgi:hypothetical protein
MAGRGFKAQPSSIHGHATRTGQRADQVSQTGGAVGGAGLPGSALGIAGQSTASRHQQLAGQGQTAISRAGSNMQGQAGLLHQTGNNITETDTEHASRIGSINAPTNHTRNPHAASGPSTSRPASGPGRTSAPPQLPNTTNTGAPLPPAANQMAQWIRDHRGNGGIITHAPRPDGAGNDVGQKLNPVVWNGTAYAPGKGANPNGSTYGGRVFGNHSDPGQPTPLPTIPAGNWDNGGYFKLQPGSAATNSRPGQYYEFDVHPTPGWRGPGAPDRSEGAGGQQGRIVAGDNGSMYYTGNHYGGFQQIQGPTIQPPA